LPLELVGNRESFLFPVDTERYRDEAIMPGDLVIVNRSSGVREGDMVLTDDGDNPTLCRFTNGSRVSEGRADLEILGRVVGVIRKFPEQ
jgi:SOS-response transcriptional repressor LexA